MIVYTTFEISRRVLTLFVVFDFDQTYICRKNKKNMENKKTFRFLGTFMEQSFSKFRRNEKKSKNFGGIFHNSGPEFRLLVIPKEVKIFKKKSNYRSVSILLNYKILIILNSYFFLNVPYFVKQSKSLFQF